MELKMDEKKIESKDLLNVPEANDDNDTSCDSGDEVFAHGKNLSRQTDGPVRLYYYEQYYSPRKLPYKEIEEFETASKDENELKKRMSKRFISSIIRREKHVFHHYLATVKIDINDTGGQSWTPIMFAIQKKRDYFVKHLLYSHSLQEANTQSYDNKENNKENDTTTSSTTSTTTATTSGVSKSRDNKKTDSSDGKDKDNKLAKYLSKMGICSYTPYCIDLQWKDPVSNRSVIHLLCERGDAGILEKILKDCDKRKIQTDKPILIDDFDKKGHTGLYIACGKGFDDIVKVLLNYGADPNIKTKKDKFFGLLKASEKGHVKVVKTLLDHNKNILEKKNYMKHKKNEKNKKNDRILCNVNETDARGRTGLMVACAEDRREIVKMFIDYPFERVNLNVTDSMNFNWNCLMWAVFRRNYKIAQQLINCDLDINYWHKNSENEYILDMCNQYKASRSLKLEIWLTMMKKYFRPAICASNIIKQLDVPRDIVDVVCRMLY